MPKLSRILTLLIATSLLFSCKDENSYWDAEKDVFYIPSQRLSLHLPHNEGWAIADPANLPNNILFFGVIPKEGIGLYLFSEDDIQQNTISEFAAEEIKQQIYPIFNQSLTSQNTTYGDLNINRCSFFGTDAIKFSSTIEIEGMGAQFSGYLFFHNGHLMKYVLSEPYPLNDEFNNQLKDILENSIARL